MIILTAIGPNHEDVIYKCYNTEHSTNQLLFNITEGNVCNVVLQSIKVQRLSNRVNIGCSYSEQILNTNRHTNVYIIQTTTNSTVFSSNLS